MTRPSIFPASPLFSVRVMVCPLPMITSVPAPIVAPPGPLWPTYDHVFGSDQAPLSRKYTIDVSGPSMTRRYASQLPPKVDWWVPDVAIAVVLVVCPTSTTLFVLFLTVAAKR